MNPEQIAPVPKPTEQATPQVCANSLPESSEPVSKLQKVVEKDEEEEESPEGYEIDYMPASYKSYFASKTPANEQRTRLANILSHEESDKMIFMLKQGYVKIAPQALAIEDLLQQFSAVGREESKLKNMMERKARLQSEIQLMQQAIRESPEKTDRSKPKGAVVDAPAPPEHKQFIERMMKARKVAEQRRKMKLQYETKRMIEITKKEEEDQKDKLAKLRVERQEIAKQRMEEVKQRKEAEEKESKESMKRYKSAMEQRKLYEIMQEHYKNIILLPTLEERKKVLEEKRKLSKPIDAEQLQKFEENYLLKRSEMLQQFQSKRKSDDWHYQPPPVTDKLYKILEEERMRQIVKQEEKKRAIEAKISRQEAFNQYLKEKYPPKAHHVSSKRPPTPKKGKQPLPFAQKRRIGDMYLAEIKVKAQDAKKRQEQNQSLQSISARTVDPSPQSRQSSSKSSNLKANTSIGHYSKTTTTVEHDTKRLDRIMSSKVDRQEKLKQLKLQAERLGERAHWRSQMKRTTKNGQEADAQLEYLLGSIKAKVGIIDLYRRT